MTTNKGKCSDIKKQHTGETQKQNTHVNKEKTEKYAIKRGGDDQRKEYKFLVSLFDREDIKHRKTLSVDTFNNFKIILETEKV